jgi:hypothetical protein
MAIAEVIPLLCGILRGEASSDEDCERGGSELFLWRETQQASVNFYLMADIVHSTI